MPKVYAKSENLKKHPRFRWHPFGTLFDSNGMAEWPDDAFTQRRLRDGDVTLEEPAAEKKAEPVAPRRGARSEASPEGAST